MKDDNLYSDTTVHHTSSIILFNAESFPLNITTEHSKNRCLPSELMTELIACVFFVSSPLVYFRAFEYFPSNVGTCIMHVYRSCIFMKQIFPFLVRTVWPVLWIQIRPDPELLGLIGCYSEPLDRIRPY